MKLSVLAAFLTLAAFPAFAQSVRVVDGDTLKIDGVTYRLWGSRSGTCGEARGRQRSVTNQLFACSAVLRVASTPMVADSDALNAHSACSVRCAITRAGGLYHGSRHQSV
jgi:hypothetical protein